MIRPATTGSLCLLALSLCGCTSLFTAQAIDAFNQGLIASDLAALQQSTSSGFQQRALRDPAALDSIKSLPLPKEEGKVTEVKEVGPDEKLLSVEVGDPPQLVQYRLKRETPAAGKSPKWLVDDVILTQKRAGSDALLTKSVSEQMDLLLTVQEFVKNWRDGSREETLAVLHPDLKSLLDELSPVHLAQITNQMLEGVRSEEFKPEARIQSRQATISLPRRGGKLVVEMVRLDGPDARWVVKDIAAESSRGKESSRSVAHIARCIGPASAFLRAYESADHETLNRLASETFYQQSLQSADLTTVPLPVSRLLSQPFELEEHDRRIDLLFTLGEDTYLISMTREAAPEAIIPSQGQPERPCRIDEITIYERGGSQIKPLSSVFTAQAVVEVFAEALNTRDVDLLSQLSTLDFDRRVWKRLEAPELLSRLPLEAIPPAAPRIVTTVFQGPVTEITVTQGTRALTYVLHSGQGRPQVDDIKYPSNNRAGSLKTDLEAVVPVYNFAWAWEQQDQPVLVRNSSEGLRRMVWIRTKVVPELHVSLNRYLPTGAPRIEAMGGDRLLTFGTPERGMQVRLVREHDQLFLEDAQLIGPELPSGRLEVVNAMRDWIIAQTTISAPPREPASQPALSASPRGPAPQSKLTSAPRGPAPQSRAALHSALAVTPAAAPDSGAQPAVTDTSAAPPLSNKPLLQQPITIPGT